MISKYFTTTFNIYGQEWSNNKSTETKTGSFKGHIQKTDIGFAEQIGGDLTKTYTIWCPVDTDVDESNTLKTGSGDNEETYSIRTIRTLDIGNNQHKRLIVEKD